MLEVRFLVVQAEALDYTAHLAQVLHDQETVPQRQKFLATLAAHCTTLHTKVINLLQ